MLGWKYTESSIVPLALIALALLAVSALAVDALAEYGPAPGRASIEPHGAAALAQQDAGNDPTDRDRIVISAICITEAAIRTCYAQ